MGRWQHAKQLAAWRVMRGARMRAIREYRGYTQPQLIEACGGRFGRSAYTKYEMGTRPLDDEFAARFCLALGCTADYLLLGLITVRMVQLTDLAFCERLLKNPALGVVDARTPRRRAPAVRSAFEEDEEGPPGHNQGAA